MTSSGNETRRRRGVQASRAKLTRALTEAGLRTQAALAERIAELEGLDAAPKDMVSRAFRELPVELQTLERIARALDVEAWTLYRSADEEALPAPAVAGAAPRSRMTRQAAIGVGLALAVLAIGGVMFTVADRGGHRPEVSGPAFAPTLSLGDPSFVVLAIDGDEDDALAAALREALAEDFQVAAPTAQVLTRDMLPTDAMALLRTDAAISGEVVRVGRLTGVRFDLYADGVRRQVWAQSAPSAAFSRSIPEIVDKAAAAIRYTAGTQDSADAPRPYFPLAPVQDEYLRGRFYLDRPENELNIRRSRNHFESALRQDANYARAHAGLCEALLAEHWMENEALALEDAARTCGQALQLAPDDPVVAAAHARFLSRTGRNDEAIRRYEEILSEHPDDANILEGLASARLQAYREGGDETMLRAAMQAARAAADSDPAAWKPLFSLATMRWFDGDLDGAIAASEAAIERDENEYVLANLGTWYVCRGNFEAARDAYEQAQELAPRSYVGDEFLGLVYYLLGDYELSARLRQRAIDNVAAGEPEIHQMWGALGDSYRLAGDDEHAVAAYLRAAEILERDHLRGTAPAADRTMRAYYYMMLRKLDPAVVPDGIVADISAELVTMGSGLNDATAYRRLAQVWLLQGDRERARQALEMATATCPGYADFPDLAALASPAANPGR